MPSGLLGAALSFWGWQTGLWVPAAAMALAWEAGRSGRWRWDISRDDFNRVADWCAVLFAGLVIYAYLTRAMTSAIMAVVAWLPVCYFPLLLSQELSLKGRFPISVLFWALRRRAAAGQAYGEVELAWPFFLMCLLSAAAANVRTPAFYLGMSALSAWALWQARPASGRAWAAAALLLAAGALGFAGQAGLHDLQGLLEKKGAEIVFGIVDVGVDPLRTQTAIGAVGSLQQSDRIVLRVSAEGGRPPALLREASYDIYRGTRWHASELRFVEAPAGAGGDSWSLAPAASGTVRSVRISAPLRKGRGLLALPNGAWRCRGLRALSVSRSELGAVKVEQGPGLAVYEADYDAQRSWDGPPGQWDLMIPTQEAEVRPLARGLGLDARRPQQALAKLAALFDKDFRYTTYQEGAALGESPLADFLLRTRRGHCEYFATAATLLLRAAGVPARYVVGYSVQEYSGWEKAFVVRGRHAHAWTLAWIDGSWRDFDPTPASWVEVESARARWWTPVDDVWSWLKHGFLKWRWRESAQGTGKAPWLWAFLAAAAAAAALSWRRLKPKREASQAPAAPARAGLDSEWFQVEAALARQGWGRRPWESWRAWARRLEKEAGLPAQPLLELIRLHERYRFDPAGISAEERAALRSQVQERLVALKPGRRAPS